MAITVAASWYTALFERFERERLERHGDVRRRGDLDARQQERVVERHELAALDEQHLRMRARDEAHQRFRQRRRHAPIAVVSGSLETPVEAQFDAIRVGARDNRANRTVTAHDEPSPRWHVAPSRGRAAD